MLRKSVLFSCLLLCAIGNNDRGISHSLFTACKVKIDLTADNEITILQVGTNRYAGKAILVVGEDVSSFSRQCHSKLQ